MNTAVENMSEKSICPSIRDRSLMQSYRRPKPFRASIPDVCVPLTHGIFVWEESKGLRPLEDDRGFASYKRRIVERRPRNHKRLKPICESNVCFRRKADMFCLDRPLKQTSSDRYLALRGQLLRPVKFPLASRSKSPLKT